MKRSTLPSLLAVTALLVLSLSFQSCNIIRSLLGTGGDDGDDGSYTNSDPTVTLSASDSSPYSDQTVTFTASASDPDGDSLTYSWSVNGYPQAQTTSSVNYYWLSSTYQYPTITVTVLDGNGGSESATVNLTVYPGASVRYRNYTGQTIYYIYAREYYSTEWGTDLLGTSTLGNTYTFTVYGLTGGYSYDFLAENSGHVTQWNTDTAYPSGFSTSSGYYRYFDLNPSSYTMNAQSNITSKIVGEIGGDVIVNPNPSADSKVEGPAPGVSIRPADLPDEDLSPGRDESLPFSF